MKNSFFDSFPEVAALWFSQNPTLVVGSRAIPAVLESAHPHGARVKVAPEGWSPRLAEQVNLELKETKHNGKISLRSAITSFSRSADGQLSIAIVFLKLVESTLAASGAIEPAKVSCPESFRPVMWGDHPWFFNYRLQMSVVSFNPRGLRALLHSEARGLLPQLVLDFCLSLPGVGLYQVRARVITVEMENRAGHGQAVFEWEDPSDELKTAITRYLFLAVPGLKPEQLEQAGYPVSEFDFAAVFAFAHTDQEFSDMLALRLEAYRGRKGSTLTDVTDPEVMRDDFDAHSLILSVRVGGRPFGTTRLVFNNGDRTRSEIAQFAALPEWLWKDGFVELSRSATLEDARGRDVFASLRRHALRVAYQSGFRYIVSDCEGHLLDPYKRRGAQELGMTFVHPLEGKILHVLYYDVPAILRGEAGDSEMWTKFWKPMAEFLGARHGESFPQL